MTSSSRPAEGASPAAGMPTSVRVAVALMTLLATLLLFVAGIYWFGREGLVEANAGEGLTRAEVERIILLVVTPYLVLGLLLAVSAWFLARRRPWARWLGVAATGVLGLLTLFSAISAGGVTVTTLLVIVLAVAAVTSLVSRTTTAWVPKRRGDA